MYRLQDRDRRQILRESPDGFALSNGITPELDCANDGKNENDRGGDASDNGNGEDYLCNQACTP
jgi:hypothetical protein